MKMANIALIIAGGVGARMGQDIPKQFINVNDRPVIIYTLEAFQKHPEIDAIEVVCLDGWHDVLKAYAKQFGIAKLENIVSGGLNGQDSIRNGLLDIYKRYNSDDDVVLIHDAIRPMLLPEIITDNIKICREYGNAITVVPCTAAMLKTYNSISTEEQVARDNLKITQTPQSFFIKDIVAAHREALEKGISVYGPTMLKSDSKAHGQFIKNALNKENIVLKSKGEQRRTYSYVVDVVSGIFKVLFNGLNGEVYNIANENSIASIAEVASICAEIAGTNVVFDLPDKIEKKGFSQSKDCILDNSKLKSLGWNGKYTLKQGLVETIESLREDE